MKKILIGLICMIISSTVFAGALTIKVYRVAKKGQGAFIGIVTLKDTCYGLLIKPELHGLTPGLHGFHIHVNPSCDNMGLAAGGHFDPEHTGKHLGPYNNQGHLGDLPALYVNKKGQAIHPEIAPRLRVRDIIGHSLVVHAGGDNYSDTPEKLGGGGKRVACALLIKEKTPSKQASDK